MQIKDPTIRAESIESPELYGRRKLLRIGAGALFALSTALIGIGNVWANNFSISNRFSPLNKKRAQRPQTLYIVLHTTEGEEKGSLNKIRQFGEAHYFVTLSGHVYRIIDKAKIATHAGRSMWEGHSNIDNYSLGIEVAGYHNKEIRDAQYRALRELLRQLKSLYKIPDDHVLTHSMVAYGRPNRFQSGNHRGRKRCGMIFANPDVRAKLGLQAKPERDPDVAMGKLKVGDPELHSYLFAKPTRPPSVIAAYAEAASTDIAAPAESNIIGNGWTAWKIARELYDDPATTYIFPNGSKLTGDAIKDWSKLPKGTKVLIAETGEAQAFEGFLEIGKDGNTARELAGDAYDAATSIYFFPDGLIRTGAELKNNRSTRRLLDKPPVGTRVLVGYIYGGYVRNRRLPTSIAGIKWNYPSTYYRYPDNKIVSGDEIDDKAIPPGTLIFYQN